jgi:hypothetical protein
MPFFQAPVLNRRGESGHTFFGANQVLQFAHEAIMF